MIGCKLMPGGRWKHEYEVADLREFLDMNFAHEANPTCLTKLRVQTVQEVSCPNGRKIRFPLRAQCVGANSTLDGA